MREGGGHDVCATIAQRQEHDGDVLLHPALEPMMAEVLHKHLLALQQRIYRINVA
jgi:hypothetical protein